LNGAVRCPRFDSCNANICPLDPQWPRAQHRQGERVCGLLTEVVKVGGQPRVASVLTGEQFTTLVREWPKVEARWSDIRSRLRDSAKTGSRIDSARANFHTPSSVTQSMPLAQVFPDASLAHTECTSGADVLVEGGE
jgi:hypothetical protein